jgi:hypothetical protein
MNLHYFTHIFCHQALDKTSCTYNMHAPTFLVPYLPCGNLICPVLHQTGAVAAQHVEAPNSRCTCLYTAEGHAERMNPEQDHCEDYDQALSDLGLQQC